MFSDPEAHDIGALLRFADNVENIIQLKLAFRHAIPRRRVFIVSGKHHGAELMVIKHVEIEVDGEVRDLRFLNPFANARLTLHNLLWRRDANMMLRQKPAS